MKADIMSEHPAWQANIASARVDTVGSAANIGRRPRILVIAEGAIRTLLLESLWLDGNEVVTAGGDEETRSTIWSIANDAMKPPDVAVVVFDGRLAGAVAQETLARLQEQTATGELVLIAGPDDYLAQVTATRLDALLVRSPVDINHLRMLIMNLSRRSAVRRTMYQGPLRAPLESRPD
jgi:DNA-binding NtrC family response regulator